MTRISILISFLLLTTLPSPAAELRRQELEFFEREIRPLLKEHCYECHSATSKKVKGELLLDTREGWMRGGENGPVIVPGNPAKSRLILAVQHTDKDLQMPPENPLPKEKIALLEAWIQMGAPDPRKGKAQAAIQDPAKMISKAKTEWPYRPLQKASVPQTKRKNWAQSDLDRFILAQLESKKLSPNPIAPPETLLRRAFIDVTGLPPTPEDISAFLSDRSANAFEKVVDRLLSSAAFGERWGRHWLDVARYADSNGLEANVNYPNAWRYRDYVIRAFNDDKPFDQFIREQLAGDLLPGSTTNQLIATGFLMIGPKAFGEPDRLKFEMDVIDEQIDVASRAFLGLTVSCARCHDHKYDPILARDYYAMAGIFRSTKTLDETGRGRGGNWNERAIGNPEQLKRYEAFQTALAEMQGKLQAAGAKKNEFPGGMDGSRLSGIVIDNTNAVLVGDWKESTYAATRFIGRDYVQDGQTGKGMKSIRYVPDIPKAGRYEVRFSYTSAFNRATNVPVLVHAKNETRTVLLDQRISPEIDNAFVSLGVFEFDAGTNGAVVVETAKTKGFVAADAVHLLEVTNEMAAPMMAVRTAPKPRVSGQDLDFEFDPEDPTSIWMKVRDLRRDAPPEPERAMAPEEGTVQNVRVNLRGDPHKLGEEVPRGFLTVIDGGKIRPEAGRSGRLELAEWIASAENPLTARVAANRVWAWLFGRGLVSTPDNFGALGDPPQHRELLDYLAGEFVRHGWSHKKLIRAVMLSSTYQMSSAHQQKGFEADPENTLHWKMNRKRMDAESIRDSMLAASGNLDRTVGGRALASDADVEVQTAMANPQSNRRSVYLPVVRNNVTDMLALFDFVDPHVVSGQRNSTTSPTQALFLMNGEFVQQQATTLASRLETVDGDALRVKEAFLRVLGRPPTSAETERSLKFLREFGAEKSVEPSSNQATTPWQAWCHALFGSTQFLFLD